MNFEKMIEYQKCDQKYSVLNNELVNSQEGKRKTQLENLMSDAFKKIVALNKDASAILGSYAAIKAELADKTSELEKFDGIFDDADGADDMDATELKYYLEKASKIKEELEKIEKRLSEASAQMREVLENYNKNRNNYNGWAGQKKAIDESFMKRRSEHEGEFKALEAQKKKIEEQFPEEIALYRKVLASARKFPVLGGYDLKSKHCPCCGMEFAGDTLSKLKNPGDYADCPNCGRLLFVPEQK